MAVSGPSFTKFGDNGDGRFTVVYFGNGVGFPSGAWRGYIEGGGALNMALVAGKPIPTSVSGRVSNSFKPALLEDNPAHLRNRWA
jgi:hypothetical protein